MNIIDKIKLFFKIKGLIEYVKTEGKRSIKMATVVKPSWQTGEFWLVVLSQAVPIIVLLFGLIPADVVIKIMAIGGIVASIFALARSIVKSSASKADDETYNRLITILKPLFDKFGIVVEPINTTETPK